MTSNHHPRQQILLLTIAVFGIAFLVYALTLVTPPEVEAPTVESMPITEAIRKGLAPIPDYTEKMAGKVASSTGFQVLVSYTEKGFEPYAVTIKKGEAIRFTNNSATDLWVAADGRQSVIYPRTKVMCGSSDLDSCEPLPPRDFWEFSFNEAGKWDVTNNLNKTHVLTVTVE